MKKLQRQITFRALELGTKIWRYGYLTEGSHNYHIACGSTGSIWNVDPDTVGQYIGVQGKDGVKIYEGDIVTAKSQGSKGTFQIWWRHTGTPCWLLYPAYQEKQFWHIAATEHKQGKKFIEVTGEVITTDKEGYYDEGIEVIGNIHEHPELLPTQNKER